MKLRIIAMMFIIILVAVMAYVVGQEIGQEQGKHDVVKHLKQPPEYWDNLVQLDQSFFKHIVTRPGTLISGTYMLETSFPGKASEVYTLELTFSNGHIVKESQTIDENLVTNGFTQEGNIISGTIGNMDEQPIQLYVGLIDGNTIWGKVYRPMSYGWHVNPTEIGIWKMYKEHQE